MAIGGKKRQIGPKRKNQFPHSFSICINKNVGLGSMTIFVILFSFSNIFLLNFATRLELNLLVT